MIRSVAVLVVSCFLLSTTGCTLSDPAGPSDGSPARLVSGPYQLRVCPPPGYWSASEPGPAYDSRPFKSLFRPDSVACWEWVRDEIDCVSTYGLTSPATWGWGTPGQPGYVYDFRPQIYRLLNMWGMPLSIEIECLVDEDWAVVLTAQEAFRRWSPGWISMESAGEGVDIMQFTIDESFRRMQQSGALDTFETAYQLAMYIQLIHSNFGADARVVILEPYPFFSVSEITSRIALLNYHLDLLGEPPLDGFTLDPDWWRFYESPPPGDTIGTGCWEDVKAIEEYCQNAGIPFGLIYWPSNACQDDEFGMGVSDEQWYDEVLFQGAEYEYAGGDPDEYVIMSWLWVPRSVADEDHPYSFMNTVREFAEEYIP